MVKLAAVLDACKARNMFLQIMWRGFSDVLGSPQAAGYIRQDKTNYFWLKNKEGKEEGQISPFCTAAAEREGLALKTLLAAAAKLDPGHQIFIGVHLQNEMTGGQDYGSVAQSLSKEQVPQDLVTFLKANATSKFDPTRLGWWAFSRWADPGHGGTRRTEGNWHELFGMRDGGTGKAGDEDTHTIMGAYYTGKYLDIVASAAKQALNIPIYCNAWMGASATDVQLFDLFHVGAPHIDGIAGDNPNWEGVQRLYKRPWNVVAAPSEFCLPESHFSAVADGAFGFGQWLSPDFELNAYRPVNLMILSMEPLLVQKNLDGKSLLGFAQFPDSWGSKLHPKAGETWEETYQNMIVKFTTMTAAGANKTYNTTGQILNGNGLIMKMDADDYVVTATKIDVELRYADGQPMRVARAEQGHFETGKWVKEEEATVEAAGNSLKLRFPTENWKYGQIRLKLVAPK